jgi:hypothetical protein
MIPLPRTMVAELAPIVLGRGSFLLFDFSDNSTLQRHLTRPHPITRKFGLSGFFEYFGRLRRPKYSKKRPYST